MKESILCCTAMVSAPTWAVCFSTSWTFFLLPSDLFLKLELLLWKYLSLQQICTSDFLLFSTVWGNWCLTVFFIFLSSFSPVPVPDSLGCFIPTSVQLSYSLASSARVMKKHTRLLSGCSFQLIVCSWIVLLRELLPRWTICPFVAGFKNTFGCWSTKAAVQYLLWL